MTESERRRIKLLKDTRERYRDNGEVPAIHPRYRNTYRSLYEAPTEDTEENTFRTLGFRTILCVIAFIIFAVMDREGESLFHINSNQVYHQITKDIDVKSELLEVWENL